MNVKAQTEGDRSFLRNVGFKNYMFAQRDLRLIKRW